MANSSYLFAFGLVVIAALVTPQVLGVTIPIPWNLNTNYGNFVKQFSFAVGDVLEFTYGSSHSVSQVSEANYDSCSGSSPINHYNSGDDKVTLSTAGNYYFICPVIGHCQGGMKIKVTAVATSTTPATPAPTPTPATDTAPTSAPAPSPTPDTAPTPAPIPKTPTTGSSPPPPPPAPTTETPGTNDSPPPPPPPPGNGTNGIKISSFMLGASFVVATALGLLC